MRLGETSAAAPALSAVSGAVHINIQNIGIRDVDAVDCDFRQPKQARELTLVNRRRSIELKTFEWMYTEVGLVKN
jgi:hypothetical protein